ncbi:methyltransferase domain-containing protein [Helicobacter sp. 11S02596-1]|uniref:methyltransferase domain-containing protein n=1 Tax=Helicobacter sp. 11S02596-1 TaxID=1476194 RepID=UPI000BA73E5F|nr:methyltransferase domain-containing protein [Helicobacter sp. 11S02596-1]
MPKIGIFGFGNVGRNFFCLLENLFGNPHSKNALICDENFSQKSHDKSAQDLRIENLIIKEPKELKSCDIILICTAKPELLASFEKKLLTAQIQKEKIRFYTDCFYISYWLENAVKEHFRGITLDSFIQMLLADSPDLKNLQKTFKTLLETTPKPDKNANFYDELYQSDRAYEKNVYYPGWEYACKILDTAKNEGNAVCVLDIGCGSGEFAKMLFDRGVKNYQGIDFSAQAISIAREKIPQWQVRFIQQDIFTTDKIAQPYSHICIFEVLEHINDDLKILSKILPQTHIIASVPNFYSKGHVRIFEDIHAVQKRYAHLLDFIDFFELPLSKKGAKIFYFHARKKPSEPSENATETITENPQTKSTISRPKKC